MSDQPLSYRFFSIQKSGEIEVDSQLVRAQVRVGVDTCEFVTPLKQLHPHPIRISKVPSTCWACLLIGGFALLMTVGGLIDGKAEGFGGGWYHWLTGAGTVVMLAIAFWCRWEQWVGFQGRDGACSVWYCRGGPDRESFDRFTEELSRRIEAASALFSG